MLSVLRHLGSNYELRFQIIITYASSDIFQFVFLSFSCYPPKFSLSTLSHFAFHSIISVARPASCCAPKILRSSAISLSRYMHEYASYLDLVRYTDMRARDCLLNIRNRQNMLWDTDFQVWVKLWLPCTGHGMHVSHCVGSEVYFSFVPCDEEG